MGSLIYFLILALFFAGMMRFGYGWVAALLFNFFVARQS
jgi:hypothetical protein